MSDVVERFVFAAVPALPAQPLVTLNTSGPRVTSARVLWLASWLTPLILLLLWESFARLGALSPQVLPAPSRVWATAWELVQQGRLLSDLGARAC